MMRANGIIPRNVDPDSVPNGHDVLNVITATMEMVSDEKGGKK